MQSDQEAEATTDTDDENVFYFESEHLALRGNPDYCSMLRAIVMLQAQKLRVHEQINELEQTKQQYLADPEQLVEKIKKNEPIISPNYMSIVEIPELSRSYNDVAPSTLEQVKVKTETVDESVVDKKPSISSSIDMNKKSETYNRLWTNEEQRRLEQLLVEYPAEEFESRRFSKIAKALGNRTVQQVSSRVQKYFLKLYEAGLPVPGRIPKYRRPNAAKNRNVFRQSTFFPAHNISIQMPEEDDFTLDRGLGSLVPPPIEAATVIKKEIIKKEEDSEQAASAEEDGMTSVKSILPHKLMLQMLKTIRDEKIKTADGYNPDPLAAKCAECEVATVSRTLWRCNSCYCYLNLCLDCLTEQLLNKRFAHITHDVCVEQEA